MFNKNKFQVNILKEMFGNNTRFRRTQINSGLVGVTDGYCMIMLHESELRIKLDGLREINFDFYDSFKNHPLLSDSHIRKIGPTVLAKLVSDDGKTSSYLKEEYLKKFHGFRFFSEGEDNPIYIKDNLGELIGVITPFRCSAKERF